jgi:hypothetical protein
MTVIKTGCNWAANKIQSSDPEPTFIGGATRTRHNIIEENKVTLFWQIYILGVLILKFVAEKIDHGKSLENSNL